MQHAKRGSPPSLFTVVPCMSWSGCKFAGADTVHAFIYVRRVSFVKCHKWRVVYNRPTLACPQIIAAAIAFEVALQVASVVFMTSQLYRRLSALSVLSRYCWVNTCLLPPVIHYDTSVADQSTISLPQALLHALRPCVLQRIHTMRWRFGDRSAGGGSVQSPSQLDRAQTRFSTKISSIIM